MNGNRNRIQIRREPAVEREGCLDAFAAWNQAGFDSLYFRVRAVEIDAIAVANNKTINRIFEIFMKDHTHAQVDQLAALNHRDRPLRRVQQIDAQDLGAAVAVSKREL